MNQDQIDSVVAGLHADKYPDGCYPEGHACDACTTRLGHIAHRIRSYRVGARAGVYRGEVRFECDDCDYYRR